MPEDSTFFADQATDRGESCLSEPQLVHSSEGGWTEIWRIDKDGKFRVLKALKPALRGQPRYESLLRKEYEIGYSLSHTAIREVYGMVFRQDLGNCIEMEWIDGVPLDTFITNGLPSQATARKIVFQLCDALAYLHSKQIVHRDVKPSNILITHNGSYVKLIDFGFSDADAWSIHKAPAGTASFAAPELLQGLPVDNRTDIWSLGKCIALLLPKEKRIIRRCTQPRKEERYRDVSEVRNALMHRHRVWPFLLAAAAVAAAVFIFIRQRPAEKPESGITDVEAIDELFRQATDLIDGNGQ